MQQLAATLLFGSAVTAATAGKLASVFEPFFRTKQAQNLVRNQLSVKVSGQEHHHSDIDEESMKMWKGFKALMVFRMVSDDRVKFIRQAENRRGSSAGRSTIFDLRP